MGIIDRTHLVLSSNFNALLSRFEEPGRDIALLLLEMKDQIHVAQRELIQVMGERKRSDAKLLELEDQIKKWEKRAELAVRHGDDGLAREALAQKQRLVTERGSATAQRNAQLAAGTAMKAAIERMNQTHRDFSSRQHTIATQVAQSRAGGGASGLGAKPGEGHFDAFDRIESGIETAEAEVSAQAEVEQMLDQTTLGIMSRSAMEEQFRQLERQSTSVDVAASRVPNQSKSGAETSGCEGNEPSLAHPRIRIESE
jgi:phage shock protein A